MSKSSVEKKKISVEEKIREIYTSRPGTEFRRELVDARNDARVLDAKAEQVDDKINHINEINLKMDMKKTDIGMIGYYEHIAGGVGIGLGISLLGNAIEPGSIPVDVAIGLTAGAGSVMGAMNFLGYKYRPVSRAVNGIRGYLLEKKLCNIREKQQVAKHKVNCLEHPEKYFDEPEFEIAD